MPIGHGNRVVSIVCCDERNRLRKNGNTYGKIRCVRAWSRIGLIGRTELDSNCRASIPACHPYSGKRERLPYKMNAKSLNRFTCYNRMVPCAANLRYYPPIAPATCCRIRRDWKGHVSERRGYKAPSHFFIPRPRPRRALVCLLPSSQRRVALQRTIQLRLVRSVFRRLSLLAAVGGPAESRCQRSRLRRASAWQAEVRCRELVCRDFDRRCGDNPPAAARV